MTNEPVISESSTGCGNNQIVTQNEADLALDLSASLLESISTEGDYNIIEHDGAAYEDGKYEATSNLCVTAALEHKILTLCGKTGGTVFKYAKMRLWMRNVGIALALNRQDITSSDFVRELIMREGDRIRLTFIQSLSGTENNCKADEPLRTIPDYEKAKDEEQCIKQV